MPTSEEELKRQLANARERLAAVEVEVRALKQIAEGVQFAGEQAVRLGERFEALKQDLLDFKEALAGVAKGCKDVVDRMDRFSDARQTSRATIIVGLLGFAGIIVTAVLSNG